MDLGLTGACCSSCSRCYGVGSIFLRVPRRGAICTFRIANCEIGIGRVRAGGHQGRDGSSGLTDCDFFVCFIYNGMGHLTLSDGVKVALWCNPVLNKNRYAKHHSGIRSARKEGSVAHRP